MKARNLLPSEGDRRKPLLILKMVRSAKARTRATTFAITNSGSSGTCRIKLASHNLILHRHSTKTSTALPSINKHLCTTPSLPSPTPSTPPMLPTHRGILLYRSTYISFQFHHLRFALLLDAFPLQHDPSRPLSFIMSNQHNQQGSS